MAKILSRETVSRMTIYLDGKYGKKENSTLNMRYLSQNLLKELKSRIARVQHLIRVILANLKQTRKTGLYLTNRTFWVILNYFVRLITKLLK